MSLTWVIGGTSGIGLAVADMIVAVHGMGSVRRTGLEVDVRDYSGMNRRLRGIEPTHIVYCAGVNVLMPLGEVDDDIALDMMNVNAMGFIRLADAIAAYPHVPVESVTVVSSDASHRPMRTSIAYCASKAALTMAARCAARELAPRVRVNVIEPGMTGPTAMSEYIDRAVPEIRGWTPEQAMEYERSQIPMGRRATPEEIAEVIVMTTFGPRYQTGSVIEVNGGR